MTSTPVLVVDDNPTNLEVLSDALMDAGFQVAIAVNGESAIKQAAYALPDLILLDIMMPGMNGFETCERLKANDVTKDIPVIFMTALSETETKVQGLSLGAVDYITKPFQQEEVIARVRTHLQLRQFANALKSQNALLKAEIQQRQQAEASLQRSKQELEQALEDLQLAQLQIIQSEKMSALGQLVAGVAHEINNPVNFIHGNLNHADQCIQNLLRLVSLYQKYYPQPVPEIQMEVEEIDIEFVQTDLPKLVNSMKTGTTRIHAIVVSLRNFSRLDESDIKRVDIHEGIDSALMILHHRLKARRVNDGGRIYDYPEIKVFKQYTQLPELDCYPGQLNQVFMNLLVNAIDALEDTYRTLCPGLAAITANSKPAVSPMITIRTECCSSGVRIAIADNGPGIPDDQLSRVFDPFFTTKPVGKGTGMGLAISYQIVTEKHQGTISCTSIPGKGTEFVIEIPFIS